MNKSTIHLWACDCEATYTGDPVAPTYYTIKPIIGGPECHAMGGCRWVTLSKDETVALIEARQVRRPQDQESQ